MCHIIEAFKIKFFIQIYYLQSHDFKQNKLSMDCLCDTIKGMVKLAIILNKILPKKIIIASSPSPNLATKNNAPPVTRGATNNNHILSFISVYVCFV